MNININISKLMVTRLLLASMLFLLIAARRQETKIIYAQFKAEALTFAKYLSWIENGYFIDIGGYYPLQASNTAMLTGWKGLIVQANEQRARYHNLLQPELTTLSFAMSNASGEVVTFYQAGDVSSLSPVGTSGKQATPIKVLTINLAHICHKYYQTRPTIMNIDIQGMGQLVLKSNDWTTEKCRPDIIFAEDFQNNVKVGFPNIEELLRNQKYVKIDKVGPLNKIFIREDKVQMYKKQADKNKDVFSNLKFISWGQMSQDIGTIIGSPIQKGYRVSNQPAVVYIRQPSVINILELNKYYNQISQVGLNRPIFVLEYDEKISSLYLGTDNFTAEQQIFKQSIFQKIIAQYSGYTLTIYIFNNQKYDNFRIRFVDASERKAYFQKVPDTFADQIKLAIIFIMLASAGIIYFFYRRRQNSILALK